MESGATRRTRWSSPWNPDEASYKVGAIHQRAGAILLMAVRINLFGQ